MRTVAKQILASIVGAAIVANVAFLFRVNERLARLETKIEWLTARNLAHYGTNN